MLSSANLHPLGENPESLVVEEEPATGPVSLQQQLGQPHPALQLAGPHHQPAPQQSGCYWETKLLLLGIKAVAVGKQNYCCLETKLLLLGIQHI